VETLRAQFAAFPILTPEGEELTITCSAGIAELPLDGLDAATLLARADRRLLAAKRAGRDRLHSHDEEAACQAEARPMSELGVGEALA
jgi:two-component system, cell cycle response regulator